MYFLAAWSFLRKRTSPVDWWESCAESLNYRRREAFTLPGVKGHFLSCSRATGSSSCQLLLTYKLPPTLDHLNFARPPPRFLFNQNRNVRSQVVYRQS